MKKLLPILLIAAAVVAKKPSTEAKKDNWAKRSWTSASNGVKKAATSTKEGVVTAWNATTNGVKKAATATKDGVVTAWDATTDVVEKGAKNVAKAADRVVKTIAPDTAYLGEYVTESVDVVTAVKKHNATAQYFETLRDMLKNTLSKDLTDKYPHKKNMQNIDGLNLNSANWTIITEAFIKRVVAITGSEFVSIDLLKRACDKASKSIRKNCFSCWASTEQVIAAINVAHLDFLAEANAEFLAKKNQ